jgi:hypothetical protein
MSQRWLCGLATVTVVMLRSTVPLLAADGSTRILQSRVPINWETAHRVMLRVKDISLPKNQPVIFEIYACQVGGQDVRLGSFGVLAESETAEGTWKHEEFLVNVTRPFRRWMDANRDQTTVKVRIKPVDGNGRPLPDLDWLVREVELKSVPKR